MSEETIYGALYETYPCAIPFECMKANPWSTTSVAATFYEWNCTNLKYLANAHEDLSKQINQRTIGEHFMKSWFHNDHPVKKWLSVTTNKGKLVDNRDCVVLRVITKLGR